MRERSHSRAEAALWRRRSFEVQASEVVVGRTVGPEPPRPWNSTLKALIGASRQLNEAPSWWTPTDAYFGSVETRTDPSSYYWDGMKRLGRRDRPLVFFQFTLAGFGHFESYGRTPHVVTPGTGFFAVIPSRHRYYLPQTSPGWSFAWLGIYHPYLMRRIAKQVAESGPLVKAPPNSPLIKHLVRLVRGAFLKDFRDRFEVEKELFEFTLAFERLVHEALSSEGERLLDTLRSRVLSDPTRALGLELLAAERGVTPTAFSHFFRAQTGLTPARFITEVRVQMAARLLVTTRLSLDRIAAECGFANGNHFGKVFRRFRHQSPGTYRRSVG
ncbi:MAG: AraC family transcriptional regulator [Myxococcales bacterium]